MQPKHQIIVPEHQRSFVFKTIPHPYPLCVWHQHSQIEIHLIHHAEGQLVAGDYIGEFSHGHLVLIGPRLPHNWYSLDRNSRSTDLQPQKDYVIQFAPELILQTIGGLPEGMAIARLLETSCRGFEFFGAYRDRAEGIIMAMETADEFARLTLLFELLQALARCEDRRSLASPAFLREQDNAEDSTQIEAVLALVRKNFTSAIRQSDMAGRFNMTAETFSRFFKRHTGQTFVRYLNSVRVGESCSLLMEEKLSITEIAFSVGFNNLSNFNRRFFEEKGVTPREFRARSRVRHGSSVARPMSQPDRQGRS